MMDLKKLSGQVRKAIDTYKMINEGDRIALGISGGKDSLSLLYALSEIRCYYPKKFELIAITVDLGYVGFDLSEIELLCQKLNVEYHIIHTSINEMIINDGCSLCARLRKGALHEKAIELGCNKIAYAHNMNDVVETVMLSLVYEGRFSTFNPVTVLGDSGLTLIRPLIFVSQANVIGFKNKYQLPVVSNPCAFEKISERKYVRELLEEINRHAPGVNNRIMTAIMDGTIAAWKTD